VLTADQWQKFQQVRDEMKSRRGPGAPPNR